MTAEIRTTWRDRQTGLVHGVSVSGVVGRRHETLLVDHIVTDCGIPLTQVNPDGDGAVTCALCLDGDWLAAVVEDLPAEEDEVEAPPLG